MTHVINNVLIGLNSIGRVFCDYAAGVFVQSALLVILLLVVDLLLRKRVRAVFRYCVWLLVLVKLVLPPTLSLPTGIGYWFGDHLPAASSISDRAFDMAGLERASPSAEMPQFRPARVLPDNDSSMMLADSALTPLTWQAVLFILWLVGVLAFLVVLVQRIRFVRGLIAVSNPAKKELLGLLEQCRRKIGVRWDIRLRISDAIPSPAVCGFFRPTVLIPATLVEKLSPEGLRATLIHELAHIKRGDLWVNSVQTFLQVIYFYNPFVWFANAVIRRICEEAVDETVLVTLGGQAKNYSNTLIDIGEMAFWRADLGLRLIGVAESKKALQWRIKHMLNRPIPKSSKLGALGIIVIFTIAAVLLPMARAQKPGEKSEPIASENQQKSSKSLHEAAADGNIRLIESLISQGADVNAKDEKEGLTPLHRAVVRRSEEVIELLLAKGADVNAKNNNGWTPLDFVADRRRKNIAPLLLSQMDDVSLYTAAYVGYLQKVKNLIDAGMDVNAKNIDGQTGLHGAAKYCHMDVIEFLLNNGARINEKENNGETALHYAARCNGVPSATPKDLITLLLSKGAGVNEKNIRGETPVEIALPWQSKEVIDLLIDKGADVSAIHLAAYTGDLDRVKSLVELGKNAGAANSDGLTPLHAAAISGQKDVAEFLIGKGVDINVHDQPNRRPGPMDTIPTPVYYAADSGHANIVKLLIDKGVNMAVAEMNYFSPLDSAILGGHNDVAELLITGGADVSNLGGEGIAPLHWAAMMGNSDVFGQLISHGADVDIKANQVNVGNTPLHYVVRNQKIAAEQRKEMCELLLAQGADVNIKNLKGQTPLHSAVRVGDANIVKLLISKGANINAVNKRNRTPLDLAKKFPEIAELLHKHEAKE